VGLPPTRLDGVHVLVVDDNADALEIMQAFLTHGGAVVTTARNGAEALGALREIKAHVIVSDLSMPGLDGYEFLERVRALPGEAQHPTPAIAVSAFNTREHRSEALRRGFRLFMPKPIDPATLADAVSRLASGETP
jgi:CheY-like chemotaxis protein